MGEAKRRGTFEQRKQQSIEQERVKALQEREDLIPIAAGSRGALHVPLMLAMALQPRKKKAEWVVLE